MAKRGTAKRGNPAVLRYVVSFLKCHSGMNQTKFGKTCQINQAEISRFELGKKAPSEEQLQRMAKAADIDWSVVANVRQFYTSLLPCIRRDTIEGKAIPAESLGKLPPRIALPWETETFDLKSLEPVLLAMRPYLLEARTLDLSLPPLEDMHREAEQIWTALEQYPISFRRRVIELYPGLPNWALAVQVCEASVKSAPNDTEESLELAQLAVSIAERVPTEEDWRSRLLGYCWAYVGNARRVANDLTGAEKAFTQAWQLWRAGESSKSDLVSEWRLLSLEASLRRAQRRFSEALGLLARARACQTEAANPTAKLNLLLKEATILTRMGDPRSAVDLLNEGSPLCEASGERQMLLALRFNMGDALCQLGHFEEAAQLLPQVRELAFELANELDLIRVQWLSARVAAGQGRMAEAVSGLEQVSADVTARQHPYSAALVSLDLAVLLLKVGRTAKVKRLALAMGWIFKAKGIDREALAALSLFCDAAQQEAATVEMALRARADVEQANYSADS